MCVLRMVLQRLAYHGTFKCGRQLVQLVGCGVPAQAAPSRSFYSLQGRCVCWADVVVCSHGFGALIIRPSPTAIACPGEEVIDYLFARGRHPNPFWSEGMNPR